MKDPVDRIRLRIRIMVEFVFLIPIFSLLGLWIKKSSTAKESFKYNECELVLERQSVRNRGFLKVLEGQTKYIIEKVHAFFYCHIFVPLPYPLHPSEPLLMSSINTFLELSPSLSALRGAVVVCIC